MTTVTRGIQLVWHAKEAALLNGHKCQAYVQIFSPSPAMLTSPNETKNSKQTNKNPCSGGHEIYNFGRPFRGHHYYTFRLSEPSRKVFSKKYMNFTIFTPKLPPLGIIEFTISCLLTLQMLHTKFDPVVLKKIMLTQDGRRTMHDDGHQPTAIGHLSDSCDLIIPKCMYVYILQ